MDIFAILKVPAISIPKISIPAIPTMPKIVIPEFPKIPIPEIPKPISAANLPAMPTLPAMPAFPPIPPISDIINSGYRKLENIIEELNSLGESGSEVDGTFNIENIETITVEKGIITDIEVSG